MPHPTGSSAAAQPYRDNAVTRHIASGTLTRVLDEWSPVFPGYYIYYPSRRQNLPAFKVVVDTLRQPDR